MTEKGSFDALDGVYDASSLDFRDENPPVDLRDTTFTAEGFLRSPGNLVGIGLAATVFVVYLAMSVFPWWFAGGLALLSWLLCLWILPHQKVEAPAEHPSELTPIQVERFSLLKSLEESRTQLERKAPSSAALVALDRLVRQCAVVIKSWADLGDAPSQKATVETVVKEHIPTLLASFTAIPTDRLSAVDKDLVDSLGILEREVSAIANALAENKVRDLRTNKLALELQYGSVPKVIDTSEDPKG